MMNSGSKWTGVLSSNRTGEDSEFGMKNMDEVTSGEAGKSILIQALAGALVYSVAGLSVSICRSVWTIMSSTETVSNLLDLLGVVMLIIIIYGFVW